MCCVYVSQLSPSGKKGTPFAFGNRIQNGWNRCALNLVCPGTISWYAQGLCMRDLAGRSSCATARVCRQHMQILPAHARRSGVSDAEDGLVLSFFHPSCHLAAALLVLFTVNLALPPAAGRGHGPQAAALRPSGSEGSAMTAPPPLSGIARQLPIMSHKSRSALHP